MIALWVLFGVTFLLLVFLLLVLMEHSMKIREMQNRIRQLENTEPSPSYKLPNVPRSMHDRRCLTS